eukprot:Nk52_evm17s151 gene=Nk52_evmTU17s151
MRENKTKKEINLIRLLDRCYKLAKDLKIRGTTQLSAMWRLEKFVGTASCSVEELKKECVEKGVWKQQEEKKEKEEGEEGESHSRKSSRHSKGKSSTSSKASAAFSSLLVTAGLKNDGRKGDSGAGGGDGNSQAGEEDGGENGAGREYKGGEGDEEGTVLPSKESLMEYERQIQYLTRLVKDVSDLIQREGMENYLQESGGDGGASLAKEDQEYGARGEEEEEGDNEYGYDYEYEYEYSSEGINNAMVGRLIPGHLTASEREMHLEHRQNAQMRLREELLGGTGNHLYGAAGPMGGLKQRHKKIMKSEEDLVSASSSLSAAGRSGDVPEAGEAVKSGTFSAVRGAGSQSQSKKSGADGNSRKPAAQQVRRLEGAVWGGGGGIAGRGGAEEDLDVDVVLAHQRKVQDKIADELVFMAQSLRHNAEHAGNIVAEDNAQLDKTLQTIGKNEELLRKERDRLGEHIKQGNNCTIFLLLLMVMFVFMWMIVFIRLFPK